MFVSGFTFIRNAVKYDYPVVESVNSVLPLVDEMIVAVGNSDDATRQLIENIPSAKIKIIDTVWDDSLREGGRVLAVETDKAFNAVDQAADWCIYIQADEALHEKDYDHIRQAMKQYKDDMRVQGLLFRYNHFYGSYDFIGDSRRWYRNEIRIIRNDKAISSFRDAQGFQRQGKRLRVKSIDACVYHYGWVKPPEKQMAKRRDFEKLWHDNTYVEKKYADMSSFDYSQVDALKHFDGTHPAVMQNRIDAINWKFDFDPTVKNLSFKLKVLHGVESLTGWRIGEYKNYKLI